MSDYLEPTGPAVGGPQPDEPPAGTPVTGHPTIDASLHALAVVVDAAPADQLPAYQAAHRTLRETLAGIDEAEADGGGSPGGSQPAL